MDLDVVKQSLAGVHQPGEFALNINDHQTAVLYIKHSLVSRCLSADAPRQRTVICYLSARLSDVLFADVLSYLAF